MELDEYLVIYKAFKKKKRKERILKNKVINIYNA